MTDYSGNWKDDFITKTLRSIRINPPLPLFLFSSLLGVLFIGNWSQIGKSRKLKLTQNSPAPNCYYFHGIRICFLFFFSFLSWAESSYLSYSTTISPTVTNRTLNKETKPSRTKKVTSYWGATKSEVPTDKNTSIWQTLRKQEIYSRTKWRDLETLRHNFRVKLLYRIDRNQKIKQEERA